MSWLHCFNTQIQICDLHLCFRLCRLLVFPFGGSFLVSAVANMNMPPSNDIQQPPPYNFSSYAPPPPYMGSSTNVRRDLAPYSGSATNAQRELPPYSGTTTNDHGTLPFLGYAPPTYTASARNALSNMPVGTI